MGRWVGRWCRWRCRRPGCRSRSSRMAGGGEPGVLDELLAAWERDGVRARRVPVDYASHSVQVEAVEAELLELLAPIAPRPGRVPFYSASEGGFIDTAGLDARYW